MFTGLFKYTSFNEIRIDKRYVCTTVNKKPNKKTEPSVYELLKTQ